MNAASSLKDYKESQHLNQRLFRTSTNQKYKNSSIAYINSKKISMEQQNPNQPEVNQEQRILSSKEERAAKNIEKKYTSLQIQNETQFIKLMYVACILVCFLSFVFNLYKHKGHLLDIVEVN